MNRFLPAALCLLWLLCPTADGLAYEKPTRQVFFLSSYQNGYSWSDGILDGVRSVFAASGYAVDLQVEYLDARRYPHPSNLESLRDHYKAKFAQTRFDAVIASDNDAFDFLMAHGREIFPGVPLVFCGVNDFKPEMLAGRDDVTGVMEIPDVAANLSLALSLHSWIKRCVVIADPSLTSQAILAQVKDAMPGFAGQLVFDYVIVHSLADLLFTVQNLPPESFIFFLNFYVDEPDFHYSPEDLLQRAAEVTPAPIYSAWTFFLGRGIVGGKLLSGPQQGETAATMALDLFGGARPTEIPIISKPGDNYVFDYKVLQRFRLLPLQLPKDHLLVNAPQSFYELQKPVFWTIMASLVVLLFILVQLALVNRKRRKAEGQVTEQLGFMQLLLDTIPQLVYWKDTGLRYMGANKSFVGFFGLEEKSVIGLANRDLLTSDEYAGRGEASDLEVLHTGRPLHDMVWEVAKPDGTAATLSISKAPLRDPKGQVVGVLSTAEDITRKVHLERQLLQSQKMEAIGTFVGGIAHDFNNVLTTIVNSAELALLELPPEAEAVQDVARALEAAERGSELVRQIHTYSRPSREGLEPTDPVRVAREALRLVQASLPGNIRLSDRLAGDLGICLLNPTQFRQVVMNLCTNAYQAMRETGGSLEVGLARVGLDPDEAEAAALAPGEYLRLTVRDTGPGISQDIRDKVFDPFFTTKDKGEGTGLGLSVVQGIVAGHKGAVRLADQPGEGATFEVFLPYLPRVAPAEEAADAGAALPGTERILFVEDSPDQLKAVPRALSRLGYRVLAAAGAEEALDLITDAGGVDLVVTDFDMPEINGVEFARNLGQILPQVPVVMVSGRKSALAAAPQAANIRRVLLKPYGVRELSRAMRAVLDGDGSAG